MEARYPRPSRVAPIDHSAYLVNRLAGGRRRLAPPCQTDTHRGHDCHQQYHSGQRAVQPSDQ